MKSLPDVSVDWHDDVFVDELGQRWSPATVTMQWPRVPAGLRAPALTCDVIALARSDMTAEQLASSHIQSTPDVLVAALRALVHPSAQALFGLPPGADAGAAHRNLSSSPALAAGGDAQMATKAKKRSSRGRKQDRARVAGGQGYEVRYTAKRTGRSKAAVKRAAKSVGPSRKKVERALGR
jgi:Protein of unknown function (DUF3606)